jgi:nucleotide-binding universal stress UspA family protein
MSSGIIVGYDGSPHSKAALAAAIEVAKAYGDKLIIAFGYDLNEVAGEIQDYAAAVKELADQKLTEALNSAKDCGTEVEATIVERAPAEGLVALADERDARVIVIGTRGEGVIRGVLLGSTAHKLLHLAERPVLVIPTPHNDGAG